MEQIRSFSKTFAAFFIETVANKKKFYSWYYQPQVWKVLSSSFIAYGIVFLASLFSKGEIFLKIPLLFFIFILATLYWFLAAKSLELATFVFYCFYKIYFEIPFHIIIIISTILYGIGGVVFFHLKQLGIFLYNYFSEIFSKKRFFDWYSKPRSKFILPGYFIFYALVLAFLYFASSNSIPYIRIEKTVFYQFSLSSFTLLLAYVTLTKFTRSAFPDYVSYCLFQEFVMTPYRVTRFLSIWLYHTLKEFIETTIKNFNNDYPKQKQTFSQKAIEYKQTLLMKSQEFKTLIKEKIAEVQKKVMKNQQVEDITNLQNQEQNQNITSTQSQEQNQNITNAQSQEQQEEDVSHQNEEQSQNITNTQGQDQKEENVSHQNEEIISPENQEQKEELTPQE